MKLNIKYLWDHPTEQTSRSYTCGYCGSPLASQLGFHGKVQLGGRWHHAAIYICHFCSRPTYFDSEGDQVPGVSFGNDVKDIDDSTVSEFVMGSGHGN